MKKKLITASSLCAAILMTCHSFCMEQKPTPPDQKNSKPNQPENNESNQSNPPEKKMISFEDFTREYLDGLSEYLKKNKESLKPTANGHLAKL